MGDQKAGGALRARGQLPIALAVLVAMLAAGVVANRVGPKAQAPGAPGLAPSGAWVCPHGGGPGWNTTLFLSNPGDSPATVEVTALSRASSGPVASLTLAGGTTTRVQVPSGDRSSSTSVEWFGGWVAAGWVAVAGGPDKGVTAEACGSAGSTWFAPDGSTHQGSETTYLIVANPSAADAVFSVSLFAPDRAPIRESKWSNLVLPGHRSIALRENDFAVSEAVVSAELDVSSGRVAVSSLGISTAGGVRSSLGSTSLVQQAYLPLGAGIGQSELLLMTPNQGDLSFGATLLSGRPPQPAGGMTQATQGGQSARSYPIISDGPSSVDVTGQGTGFSAALRSRGTLDSASTAGAAPATAWLVLPTVAGEPSVPGLVLVNPGSGSVDVTLHLIGAAGLTLPADVTVTVPADSVGAAPPEFLAAAPLAAVLVRSASTPIIALGSSTSLGSAGSDGYCLAVGVVPPAS